MIFSEFMATLIRTRLIPQALIRIYTMQEMFWLAGSAIGKLTVSELGYLAEGSS